MGKRARLAVQQAEKSRRALGLNVCVVQRGKLSAPGGENDLLRCARPSFVCEAAFAGEREDERHTVLGDRKAPSSAGRVSEQSFSSH